VVAGRFVLEYLSGFLAREPPVDLRPLLVGPTVPGLGLAPQLFQIWNPPFAQTLPRVQTAFDFRWIEPVAVFWGVVHGEPVPNVSTLLLAEVIGQRFTGVYVEVVHNQVNRAGRRVLLHDVPDYTRELVARTVGCGGSECGGRSSVPLRQILWPCRTGHFHCPVSLVFQAGPVSADVHHRAARSVFHPGKRRVATRGSAAKSGLFRGPPWAPVCA